jgi:hypothetical protein
VNGAYKHLDTKLRIGELTVGQWAGVIAGAVAGVAWGLYLSPFGLTLTLSSAIYLATLPAGAAAAGSLTDLDPWLIARSALAWRRRTARFVPGGGASARGYVVARDDDASIAFGGTGPLDELTLHDLWESQDA